MTDIFIEGGRALLGEDILETSLQIADGEITAVGSNHGRHSLGIDASGLKVLPGIVDLHGDAFERQMMPRPGVDFPVDVALLDVRLPGDDKRVTIRAQRRRHDLGYPDACLGSHECRQRFVLHLLQATEDTEVEDTFRGEAGTELEVRLEEARGRGGGRPGQARPERSRRAIPGATIPVC
mgnify:CR=1 FL=1